MILFPAVDILGGKAARLKRGVREEATIFGEPVELALKWRDYGARWLHVIDLDAAFDGKSDNDAIIAQICAQTGLKVQVGGGVRDLDTARKYLDAGAERLIIGTLALENPALFARLCSLFPGRVGVSLDAVDGKLKSRGWLADTGLRVKDVLPRLTDAGCAFLIYTDIKRDGMRSGINLEAIKNLLAMTSVSVIAAGGAHSLEDVKTLSELPPPFEGMISGRAIYDNSINLREALEWLAKKGRRNLKT